MILSTRGGPGLGGLLLGVSSGGYLPGGAWSRGSLPAGMPGGDSPGMATAVGGTHPT